MKFIAKYIHAIGLLMLTGFVAAAAALYFDLPARAAKRPAAPAVVSDSHASCNHVQPSSSAKTEKPAATGSGHSDGCCSAKTETATPSVGGCTRNLVVESERANP